MIKILITGVLIYLLYRLVVPAKALNEPEGTAKITKNNEDSQNPDDGEYADYEEIE